MKHLLNDMSSEEKNSILEQHTGGKQIDTSRFRSLLESTLGDAKPLVNEEEEDEEVVVSVDDIAQEDMNCFSDVATPPGKKGKYKVKKKGCMTKTRYKGPKQKYSGRSFPGMG